jgi:hypothetical protein
MGTKIHNVRSKAGTVKNLPRYFFENKKKKITDAKRGITQSRGSTLVERSASRISDTPPVNVSEFAPKYAGTASAKNGETRIAPRKIGTSQVRICFFDTPSLLEKTAAIITVENVMHTNIIALREWVKNMAPDKIVVVTRKGTVENLSLSK